MSNTLPDNFADLKRFVPEWVHSTERGRNVYRVQKSMSALHDFYDTMLPRMEAISSALDAYPLDALPRPAANLP
jgi:hypothetical protein